MSGIKGLRSLALGGGGGSGLVLKDLWLRPFRGAKILVSRALRSALKCGEV